MVEEKLRKLKKPGALIRTSLENLGKKLSWKTWHDLLFSQFYIEGWVSGSQSITEHPSKDPLHKQSFYWRNMIILTSRIPWCRFKLFTILWKESKNNETGKSFYFRETRWLLGLLQLWLKACHLICSSKYAVLLSKRVLGQTDHALELYHKKANKKDYRSLLHAPNIVWPLFPCLAFIFYLIFILYTILQLVVVFH